MKWMLTPYRRYFDFSGRSRRTEYWMFLLLGVILQALAFMLLLSGDYSTRDISTPGAAATETSSLPAIGLAILVIYALVSFIPGIAVQVRRFHDQNRSGWFSLIGLVPFIGGPIVVIFMCLNGSTGPNRFGSDPRSLVGSQIIT